MLFYGLFIYLVLALTEPVFTAKILMIPSNGYSHCTDMAIVAEALIKHGHYVNMLISSAHPCTFHSDRKFDVTTIKVEMEMEYFEETQLTIITEGMVNPFNFTAMSYGMRLIVDLCEQTIQYGGDTFSTLRRQKYDLAIIDEASFCGVLETKVLNLPFITISTMNVVVDLFSHSPMPPSYVQSTFMYPVPDRMTFFQRVMNTIMSAVGPLMLKEMLFGGFQTLNVRYNIAPDTTFNDMYVDTEIILSNRDNTFEFARPTMPHVIPYGSITTKPASPLPSDLENFMQSAENGVAVVCFGTWVTQLRGGVLGKFPEIIASALSRLPLKVIWKFKGYRPSNVGENTLLMDWIPQNDLLGHPKTRVFITHGGIMSVYESIYHGIPMVNVPIFGDQLGNAVRIETKGMGPVINFIDLTVDNLYDAVMEVLDNPKYKDTMMRYSEIYQDKPMNATETISYWVDYVLKHGGKHLHSQAENLSTIEYYLLDVIGVLLLVTFLIMSLILWICRCMCRCCMRMKTEKLKTN
ncbi:UDP-glucuronosyltransferase 2C1-like [Glandiceps talaboti]